MCPTGLSAVQEGAPGARGFISGQVKLRELGFRDGVEEG